MCASPDSPIDERRLPGRVVPNEHDRDLLPGRQQLEPEVGGDRDESVVGVGVERVALLQDALVNGRRGEVHGGVGGRPVFDAAGHGDLQGCKRALINLNKIVDIFLT
jgi:hypothetical protein